MRCPHNDQSSRISSKPAYAIESDLRSSACVWYALRLSNNGGRKYQDYTMCAGGNVRDFGAEIGGRDALRILGSKTVTKRMLAFLFCRSAVAAEILGFGLRPECIESLQYCYRLDPRNRLMIPVTNIESFSFVKRVHRR